MTPQQFTALQAQMQAVGLQNYGNMGTTNSSGLPGLPGQPQASAPLGGNSQQGSSTTAMPGPSAGQTVSGLAQNAGQVKNAYNLLNGLFGASTGATIDAGTYLPGTAATDSMLASLGPTQAGSLMGSMGLGAAGAETGAAGAEAGLAGGAGAGFDLASAGMGVGAALGTAAAADAGMSMLDLAPLILLA